MRARRLPCLRIAHQWRRGFGSQQSIVDIQNATFYRRYPSATNKEPNEAIFPNLTCSVPANVTRPHQFWSVYSASSLSRTTFLKVLGGQYVCIPPAARSYPRITSSTTNAIKYVGFDAWTESAGSNLQGAYLSARYESRREETDFTLWDYLTGQTALNPCETSLDRLDKDLLDQVTRQLNLVSLLDRPVSSLSNGQTRRASIAQALMTKPELLLLDGPFMGLDPSSARVMSDVLHSVALRNAPSLVLSLRPEYRVPEWITHLVLVGSTADAVVMGPSTEIQSLANSSTKTLAGQPVSHHRATSSRDGLPCLFENDSANLSEPIVEMKGIKISYGKTPILGHWTCPSDTTPGLNWSIHRGQRWAIFGANGSGKTTLLSLMTSDHPQTYAQDIKLFGRARLPLKGELGLSVFDLQRRIGHSSPEVHAFFPKHLSIRRVLESAWADAPRAKPLLPRTAEKRISRWLAFFGPELYPAFQQDEGWADRKLLRDLGFSAQRLALFLRAIVADQELVILDEAFSGMDAGVRDKALLFLSRGEIASDDPTKFTGLSRHQALVTICHARDDVPGCVSKWVCLPEPDSGRPPRWGILPGPLELHPECWDQIWGVGD